MAAPHHHPVAMSRTYMSLHYHVVFGTKNRIPLLDAAWRFRLHEYLGGTVDGLGGFSLGTGGVADHVHLLAGLTASHRLSDVVREIKKASNEWIQDEMGVRGFAWQEGFAAFTVSATAREEIQHYIANQELRHRQRDFRGELMDMLKLARIDFEAELRGVMMGSAGNPPGCGIFFARARRLRCAPTPR